MGKHIIEGDDGSKLELNFTFDNGLPTKPIINPAYDIRDGNKNKPLSICIYLTDNDLSVLEDLDIKKVYFSKNELWLLINEHYIVLGDLTDKIINNIKNKNAAYFYFKENGDFISGVKLE